MDYLSRLRFKSQRQHTNTILFQDSRGITLDLRNALPPASTQHEHLRTKIREILKIYQQDRSGFPQNYNQGPDLRLYYDDMQWTTDREKVDPRERQTRLETFCTELGALASEPRDHLARLEQRFSRHLLCVIKSDIPEEVIVDRTIQVLERLPPTALQMGLTVEGLPSSLVGWHQDYLSVSSDAASAQTDAMHSTTPPWQELHVVSSMSNAVIIMCIHMLIVKATARNLASVMQIRLNFISELIDQIAVASSGDNGLSACGKHILLAYLWTDWQRSMMLIMYFILGSELMHGYDSMWNDLLALRGNSVIRNSSSLSRFDGSSYELLSDICPWAFEMLRTSRSSVGLDFRTFHQRYVAVHGNLPARCLYASSNACDGSDPLICGRFVDKRLVAAEQSMHDYSCSGSCDRLTWDPKSYRSITGGRAALIKHKAKHITYCKASDLTMAISHVWSHGQGGRPKTGINRCLHDRYCKISKQNGCESYWIDTICIPEDHDLRNEAIGYINTTFTNAKFTLVCDKDLMKIDINNKGSDVKLAESIISTFLVCDWSVRAWTLLEAFRGTHNLHLLFKNNLIIPLRQIWASVYLEGRIDLAILSLAARHFLPRSSDGFRNVQN